MWSEGLRCHGDLVTFPSPWAARGSCSWVRLRSGLGPALSFYLLCIYVLLLWVLLDSASSFSRVEFWSHFPLGFPHLWQQEESSCLSFSLPVPGNPCTQASSIERVIFTLTQLLLSFQGCVLRYFFQLHRSFFKESYSGISREEESNSFSS